MLIEEKDSQGCFEGSKHMIRLLRHDDTVHREDDGAVRLDDLTEKFKAKFEWSYAVANWSLDNSLGKRRRTEEEVSILLKHNSLKHLMYFRAIQGTFRRCSRWSYIARLCTVTERLRRVHLSHRERSRHALHHPGRIDSRRKKSQEVKGSQCFSQPLTRCTPVKIWKNFNTIWTPPELRCTKILGGFTNIQYTGAIWSSLKETDCSSIKPDRTQSLFSDTLPAICFEKVVYMKTGEDLHCKVHQSPRSPRVVLTPNLQYGRQDPPSPEARKIHRPSQRTKRAVQGNLSL